MIGKLIDGRYKVTRILGEGGMGAVYAAEHPGTGRSVAVKVIRAANVPPETMQRFKREARATAAIDSPHVVKIYDADEDRETHEAFIVMELLAGRDLDKVLQTEGAISEQAAIRVAIQALEGLQAAHSQKLVHRDVKPANVFLVQRETGELVVKLVDFGISVSATSNDESLSAKITKTGHLIGSPLYMSPEQLGAGGAIDHRTDLWSMGVVLFEMLAGANPYAAEPSLPVLMRRICLSPAPALREHAPHASPGIQAVVGRALSLNPAERYPSAGAMLADLIPLLDGTAALSASTLTPLRVWVEEQKRSGHVLPAAPPPVSSSGAAATPPGAQPLPLPATNPPTIEERRQDRRFKLIGASITVAILVAAGIVLKLLPSPARPAAEPRPAASSPDPRAVASSSSVPSETPPVITPSSSSAASTADPTSSVASSAAPVPPRPSSSPDSRPATTGMAGSKTGAPSAGGKSRL